jgi:hypothetical protein
VDPEVGRALGQRDEARSPDLGFPFALRAVAMSRDLRVPTNCDIDAVTASRAAGVNAPTLVITPTDSNNPIYGES